MMAGMDASRSSRATLVAFAFCGVTGAASVILGALAAHALSGPSAQNAATASQYALFHAVALMVTALAADRVTGIARKLMMTAEIFFAAGIILFSGGLAASAWGMPTGTAPWGGMALIAAWLAVAAGAAMALMSAKKN
jgi:uncharacterized membrane protein YgdD (TMEM256/DUF423 family)